MNRKEFAEEIYKTVMEVCGNDIRFAVEKDFDDKAVRMGFSYYYTIRVLRNGIEVATFTNPGMWGKEVVVNLYSPYRFLKGSLDEVLNEVSRVLRERMSLFAI